MIVLDILLLVGGTVGIWAYGSGSDVLGGVIVGVHATGAVVIIGQFIFAFARPLWIGLIVAVLFAMPTAAAGYIATHGIAIHVMPSEGWQMAFSMVGVIAVDIIALFRMVGAVPPEPEVERASGV